MFSQYCSDLGFTHICSFQYALLNLVMTKHTMRHTVLNWATLCENNHMPVQLPNHQTRNQFSLYQLKLSFTIVVLY